MRSYSVYEAKARLSEILRRVRERGEAVMVTWHGEPIAEIRPIEQDFREGWAARLAELERRGVLRMPAHTGAPIQPVTMRPGALERFLKERDD
jgi:prevent-host-death family protein